MLKSLLARNSIYLCLSLTLAVALGLALLYIPKGELHLLLCDRHTYARDIFYRYYTHVAEWFPYAVCLALILFSRLGNGLCASTAMLGSALITQLFKHIIRAPRPLTWFEMHMSDVQLPLVEGVRMNRWLSFPSGHTTSFFALAFVVSIVTTCYLERKGVHPFWSILVQIALFLLAALGGYSRIYLSQHFALDVFAGIIVGVLITMICYAIFTRYEDKKWYNYRIFAKK